MQTTLLRYANKRASLIKIHDKKEVIITSKQSEQTGCVPSIFFPVEHSGAKIAREKKKAKCLPVEVMHFSNTILQFYIETINRNILNTMLFFIIFLIFFSLLFISSHHMFFMIQFLKNKT